VLLGPFTGAIVVTVVIVVQALLFADGGITALGYNVLNMAIVTSFGGWAVFRLTRRLLPASRAGIAFSAAIAGYAAVVLAAVAFSIEWLFGATFPVPFDTVFGAMVGVHALIGIGEAVITGAAVYAVLASRPDLVAGADGYEPASRRVPTTRGFAIAAVLVTLVVAGVVSQFAGSAPDGLQKVAEDQGFAAAEQPHAFDSSVFAGYATEGVSNENVSLAVAGITGSLLTLAVGGGLVLAVRRPRSRAET
jgi:cobalt/nickel transport system permease protein